MLGALFINLGGLIVFAVKFEEALSVATGLADFRCLGTNDKVTAIPAFPDLNFALVGFFASSYFLSSRGTKADLGAPHNGQVQESGRSLKGTFSFSSS